MRTGKLIVLCVFLMVLLVAMAGSRNVCEEAVSGLTGRVYSQHVQYPVAYGFVSGLSLGWAWRRSFGEVVVDKAALRLSIPARMYPHACRLSYRIFNVFRFVGAFTLGVFLYLLRSRLFRLRLVFVIFALAGFSACASSSLPQARWGAGDPYSEQVGGYSAMKYYGSPVGFYVAEVKQYSDVAHIEPSYQTVYGVLDVRRPLLVDTTVRKLFRERSDESWWRMGTVIVGSLDREEAGDGKSEVRTDVPLKERVKPVAKTLGAGEKKQEEKKVSGKKAEKKTEKKSLLGKREEVLFFYHLGADRDDELDLLVEALKEVGPGEDKYVRLIGHGDGVEEWMGRVSGRIKELGYSHIEMFRMDGGGDERGIDIVVVTREG